jgi:hypothetical protein
MSATQHPYWFHAKRYGWGWGLPATWQGWVVLITWLTAVTLISPILAVRSMLYFAIFIILMTSVLLAICFAKGEPPKWRWGNH